MKKKILLLIIIIIIIILKPKNKIDNNIAIIEQPIEIINCNINNKNYEYKIFYKNNKYIAITNEYLLSNIETNTEEELRNVITSIFDNKNGTCYIETIKNIELDF